jgi:glutaredoxin 3
MFTTEFALPRIEMYSKSTCPYCYRAEELLRAKGVKAEVYSLDAGGPKRDEMIERSGRMTVPQIFIDGRHVGGCDDLYALDRAGKLDALLTA